MNILFFGDIVGRTGREAVFDRIYDLKEQYAADICIANGENAAGGFGITRDIAEELMRVGVDAFTTGNHVWAKKEIISMFDSDISIVRPHNLPANDPGSGYMVVTAKNGEKLAIVNLLGSLYIDMPVSNPFFAMDLILPQLDTPHIILDFHGEATSEKKAMGYYLDGKVSGVFGTHTHVQTADDCVLKGGTAYITDVGMCGATYSVLGASVPTALARFTSSVRRPYDNAEGERAISAVFLRTDAMGRATEFVRISK